MTFAFVAVKPGWPGFAAASVDAADNPDARKDAAKWFLDGYEIKRVTVEEARTGLGEFLAERDRRKKAQGQLFGGGE